MYLLSLLALIGALFTFLPATIAVTKGEADVGKVAGFTHNNISSYEGDYLMSTFCYCGFGMDLPDTKYDESHYFQFEYYNVHLNTTFINQHECYAQIDDEHSCLNPRREDGNLNFGRDYAWDGDVCKTWPRYHVGGFRAEFTDEFCYMPHVPDKHGVEADYISFNGQLRNVGVWGEQGYIKLDPKVANRACTQMCMEHMGMPMLEDNDLGRSYVIVNDRVDDMCDSCK